MPKHVATIVPFADSNKSSWLFPDGSIEYTSSATEKKSRPAVDGVAGIGEVQV